MRPVRPRWARPTPRGLVVPALLGIAAGVTFLFARTGLIDDAYITLSYARNLALHFHWGLLPNEVSNTATSPLYVMLLAGFTVVLGSPVIALGAVFVLSYATLAYSLARAASRGGLPAWSGVLGTFLVLFNPLVLSSTGMAIEVAAVLLALLLLAAVERRPVLFGVVSGLIALTRLDLAVFVLVMLACRPVLWRGWWKILLSAGSVALPWFAWSWYVLGSAVPDTLVIKQLQQSWGIWSFDNGLQLYLGKYPVPTALALLAPVLGLLALVILIATSASRHDRPGRGKLTGGSLLAVGGLLHYYAYTWLDVPPYHWYYAPSVVALSIFFALAAGSVTGRARPLRVVAGLASALGVCVVMAQAVFAVQHGQPWRQAPITSNGGSPADYARVGTEVGHRVGDATVGAPEEIGTLAYFCRCTITDGFADRGYLGPEIEKRKAQVSGLRHWLLEVNYRHFDYDQQPRPRQYQMRRVDGLGPDPVFDLHSVWSPPAHHELVAVPDR